MMNSHIEKNQEAEIEIRSLSSDGQGVGRIDGYAVFVKDMLPGEKGLVKIIKAKSSYGVGKLMKLIKASPERVSPPCPVYAQCGGCSLQHLSYSSQLKFKEQQVRDALIRLGGFEEPDVLPCIGMDDPQRYRNKAAFPFAVKDGRPLFGLFAQRSHRVIPVDDCIIQKTEAVLAARSVLKWAEELKIPVYDEETGRGLLRHVIVRTAGAETMVTVVTAGGLPGAGKLIELLKENVSGFASLVHNINKARTNVITGSTYKLIWGKEFIDANICGLDFSVSSVSFLQVNAVQTERLYKTALDFADLKSTDRVIDLYCGIGTISLSAARLAKKVIGIEVVPQAIENACSNAERNGIKNAEFICGKAEEILPKLLKEKDEKADVFILDPPRKGCEKEVLEAISATNVKKMVYVSCNPATLARDCSYLAASGYSIAKAQPVDMFLHTAHVECIALMSRKDT